MTFSRAAARSAILVIGLAVPNLASAQRTVFVNLDQQAVNTNSGNDPSLNSYASNSFVPGTLDGYPALDAEQRAELLHWFKQATVPFDIHFTLERPAAGNYDMLVFGSEADNGELFPDLGCSASIGLADCTDADDENISFMFWGCMPDNQQMDLRRVAFFGLTALGFGWGLEGVGVSGQVMGTYSLSGLDFGDSCVAISGASQCTHSGCAAGQQNSSADLTPALGARIDDGPPTLTIESPANFALVDPDITITAAVADTFGAVAVTLEIVEIAATQDDDVPPHNWELSDVPEGMWTLRVTATDADANATSAEVVVCVGLEFCGGAADTGAASSEGGGDTSTSTSGGSSEGESGADSSSTDVAASSDGGMVSGVGSSTMTTSASGGFGGGGADTGCGCNSDSAGGRGFLGLGLVGLGLVARRRRR